MKIISGITGKIALAALCASLLGGCEELRKFGIARPQSADGPTIALSEQEVEAPSVFSMEDRALWDGRPSFGQVWVAVPQNVPAETVRITNLDNGKTVTGGLFTRGGPDNPGPPIQVSSVAAAALGIQAGTPVNLRIVAIRTETSVVAEGVDSGDADAATGADASELETTALDAIEASQTDVELQRPLVQVVTVSSEAGTKRVIDRLEAAGIPARSKASTSGSRTLYIVLAGPATTVAGRDAMLAKIKALGFTDAFPTK